MMAPKAALGFAVAVAGLGCAAGASAHWAASQLPEVPRAKVEKSRRLTEEERGRVTAAQFARCMVRRSARKVRAVLDLPLGRQADIAVAKLAVDDCMDEGMLKMASSVFRGALFEALYRLPQSPKLPASLPRLPARDYAAGVDIANPDAALDVALRTFADCVVRADPAASHRLLFTDIGADREQAAFQALMPVLGNCLPRGNALKFSKPVLRGLIAEVAFRLAESAAGTRS